MKKVNQAKAKIEMLLDIPAPYDPTELQDFHKMTAAEWRSILERYGLEIEDHEEQSFAA